MKRLTHIFNNKRYEIRTQKGLDDQKLGECSYDEKYIKIPIYGESKEDLDTIIHESLHAALPVLDEDSVESTATSIAALLWKLGWRYEV